MTIQEKMKLFICPLIYLLRHSQLGYEVMKVKCFDLKEFLFLISHKKGVVCFQEVSFQAISQDGKKKKYN